MPTITYPISRETAEHISRPVFGHVIDNEIVPSADGRTMPVIDQPLRVGAVTGSHS